MQAATDREAYEANLKAKRKPMIDFLLQNICGSPLYGYFDRSEEDIIVRFGLKPNDVRGAEYSVNRAIKRLNKRYAETT